MRGLSGDYFLCFKRYQSKISAMAQVLVTLHNKALAVPASDPAHGLIAGWSESDACLFSRSIDLVEALFSAIPVSLRAAWRIAPPSGGPSPQARQPAVTIG